MLGRTKPILECPKLHNGDEVPKLVSHGLAKSDQIPPLLRGQRYPFGELRSEAVLKHPEPSFAFDLAIGCYLSFQEPISDRFHSIWRRLLSMLSEDFSHGGSRYRHDSELADSTKDSRVSLAWSFCHLEMIS